MGGLATADTRLTDLDCWGGSSCAANSPYLIKLNGKAVLILGFFFSVGLLKIISAKKISKSSIWLAISTVILTLYINSGYGGIEVFFRDHLGIAADKIGSILVHLNLAMILATLFGGGIGLIFFSFIKKDAAALKLSSIITGISLLNILIEFIVAAAGA
jgi:hypothetical protein